MHTHTTLLMQIIKTVSVLVLSVLSVTAFGKGACTLPDGFVVTGAPKATEKTRFVSRTETVTIKAPLEFILQQTQKAELENTIKSDDDLPSVAGTFNLTEGRFKKAGDKRLTCLTDGSSLVEQILTNKVDRTEARFRYIVWGYTSPKAKAVDFAVGEFVRTAIDADTTKVEWTYSFVLKKNRIPGCLGALGRWVFRTFFLNRSYADMMRHTLEAEKNNAEAAYDPNQTETEIKPGNKV